MDHFTTLQSLIDVLALYGDRSAMVVFTNEGVQRFRHEDCSAARFYGKS